MIQKKQQFKIPAEKSGCRLDKFLSNEIKDSSRSSLQQMIKNGLITINGQNTKSNYTLKEDDLVIIIPPKKETIASKKIKTRSVKIDIPIVDETDDFFIVNKPASLVVHGAAHISETSLADIMLDRYPKLKKVGEDPSRPGIVHRLDKDVSGLLVIPKNPKAFTYFKELFQKRRIKKEYTALVFGQMPTPEGEISFPIERSSSGHKMAALPLTDKGQLNTAGRTALTRYETLKALINYTLLKINIITGRTHQIRAHLSAFAHPIVGDNLYGTSRSKMMNKKLGTKRIYLAATRLSFIGPDGIKYEYQTDLPEEFKELLKTIK